MLGWGLNTKQTKKLLKKRKNEKKWKKKFLH